MALSIHLIVIVHSITTGEYVNWMSDAQFGGWLQSSHAPTFALSYMQLENDRRRFSTKDCNPLNFHPAAFLAAIPEDVRGKLVAIQDKPLECFFKHMEGDGVRMINYLSQSPVDVVLIKWHTPGRFLPVPDLKGIKSKYVLAKLFNCFNYLPQMPRLVTTFVCTS